MLKCLRMENGDTSTEMSMEESPNEDGGGTLEIQEVFWDRCLTSLDFFFVVDFCALSTLI